MVKAGCQEEGSWKREGSLVPLLLTGGHPGEATALRLWPSDVLKRGGVAELGVFAGVLGGTLGEIGSTLGEIGDAKLKGMAISGGGSEVGSMAGRVLRRVFALRTVMVGLSRAKARSSSSLARFTLLGPLLLLSGPIVGVLPSLVVVSRGTPWSGVTSSLVVRLPSKTGVFSVRGDACVGLVGVGSPGAAELG